MNYELAKQLKDAGFPQDLNTYDFFYSNGERTHLSISRFRSYPKDFDYDGIVKIPTTGELIDACEPLPGFNLIKFGDRWQATNYRNGKYDGQTYDEAIAKLWVALNKK